MTTAVAIGALAAKRKGPLDKRWLTHAANICDQCPQGGVCGDTVADLIRRLLGFLDDDPGDPLDEIGGSTLATEPTPAKLRGAVTAPVPVTAALGSTRTGSRGASPVRTPPP